MSHHISYSSSSMKSLLRSRSIWKTFHFVLLLLSIFSLWGSIYFGISRVNLFELFEISISYVKKFLLLNIIMTAFIIFVQSWVGRKFDVQIDESLIRFDKHWDEEVNVSRTLIRTKLSNSIDSFLRKYFPSLVCFLLTTIPGE